MTTAKLPLPKAVSAPEWQAALDQLLVKEKELTRARDALNAERRRLPMVKVRNDYTLQGENGALAFLDLFAARKPGKTLQKAGPKPPRMNGIAATTSMTFRAPFS